MNAYYNENDPYCAEWLRNLIAEKLIPDGEVDARSIVDVAPSDLRGFRQCHFFAGIAGWSLALQLAGWPEEREVWTGSCPCQPFSVAGKRKHQADARHLWPEWFRLIRERRPQTIFGEQVAAAAGASWLDRVFVDLEEIGYAAGAAVVPACAVGAPHRRDRLWFVADADRARIWNEPGRCDGQTRADPAVAQHNGETIPHADQPFASARGLQRSGQLGGLGGAAKDCADIPDTSAPRLPDTKQETVFTETQREEGRAAPEFCRAALADANGRDRHRRGGPVQMGRGWGSPEIQADTIPATVERLAQSGIRLLAHGVPARVGKLRALGNAIVPACGAEFVSAFMEAA